MKLKIYISSLAMLCGLTLVSCSNDEPTPQSEPQPEVETSRTILIYSVAANSLNANLDADLNEIIAAAQSIKDNNAKVLVYSSKKNRTPALLQLNTDQETARFDTICKYPMTIENPESAETEADPIWISSVDPQRISEVINDAVRLASSKNYGLIMWSHSTGWTPAKIDTRWFGQDTNVSPTRYGAIPDVAAAIPDGVFDFIWFDSCYMANIESAYEFIGKCDYYIGYTTEIWSDGMPYDLTMPYLSAEEPDFYMALLSSYQYYGGKAYTGCVVDMSKLQAVADAARPILTFGPAFASPRELQYYSRNMSPILYDFGQIVNQTGLQNGVDSELLVKFDNALHDAVVTKICSTYDFSNKLIDPLIFSGLSGHLFDIMQDTEVNKFYKTFAWYKAIYEQEEETPQN